MIKGYIEQVTPNAIWGWLWAPMSLSGNRILAYLDEVCIGAGTIDGLRTDIKAALGGDGICGFDFGITYPNPSEASRVFVKLEKSDLVLLQRGARLALTQTVAAPSRSSLPRA
jgi:hypothetical protein